MRYILPETIVEVVAKAHSIILGTEATFETTLQVTDPRIGILIEVLGGKSIDPELDKMMAIMTPNEVRKSFGLDNAVSSDEKMTVEADAKTGETHSLKLCEICGTRPVTSGHAKTCDDPACKKEKHRRYLQEYHQRKVAEAEKTGVEEAPADETPLAIPGQDPQASAITTIPATQETADETSA